MFQGLCTRVDERTLLAVDGGPADRPCLVGRAGDERGGRVLGGADRRVPMTSTRDADGSSEVRGYEPRCTAEAAMRETACPRTWSEPP